MLLPEKIRRAAAQLSLHQAALKLVRARKKRVSTDLVRAAGADAKAAHERINSPIDFLYYFSTLFWFPMDFDNFKWPGNPLSDTIDPPSFTELWKRAAESAAARRGGRRRRKRKRKTRRRKGGRKIIRKTKKKLNRRKTKKKY